MAGFSNGAWLLKWLLWKLQGTLCFLTHLWQLLLTSGEPGFSLLVLDFMVFPRLAHTMFRNIFNSSHVCSMLQMDYLSLFQWFFTASSILKLWLITILRKKLHCNWITMAVLALKASLIRCYFLAFFNGSSMLSFTVRTWLQLAKTSICHYILLLGLGLHRLLLLYNVYNVLQVWYIWVVEMIVKYHSDNKYYLLTENVSYFNK